MIGEGGSGGAIATALADRVLMQENAIYTVISPEGCAAILWRDRLEAKKAAAAFKPDAAHCLELGVIDAVVPEPEPGAHADYDEAARLLGEALGESLEIFEGVSGEDLRELVASRRLTFERERRRRRIPRLLLSDGTDAEAALVSTAAGLRGSPASPGVVSGTARVILSPQGARLEPGEVLVAPSTDPGWTPLFLTAGGLVMEMGGMMSHGAVVAREYGIPAVVGVAGATEQIATGQRVTLDGSAGTVTVDAGPEQD